MSLLCRNCHGAGKASTIRQLHNLVKQFASTVLCILEIRISKVCVEGLANTLVYDFGYAIGSSERSGGLGVFWNDGIKVYCFGYSEYHTDATVSSQGQDDWRLTCIYG